MHRLICAFVVRIWHTQVFSWRGSYYIDNITLSENITGTGQFWSPPMVLCLALYCFLLYINDLSEKLHSHVRLFADDMAIYITINNHSDSDTFQQDIDTSQTWERMWDMDFNPSKCQVLHISKSRHPAQHIYMLHGQALEAMDHAKYLGVDISKDLSWNTHINRISTNANSLTSHALSHISCF